MSDDGEGFRERRFRLARSSALAAALGLTLLACPAGGSLIAATGAGLPDADADGTLFRGFAVVAAVGWNALLVGWLWVTARRLRRADGFAVDARGVRMWSRGESPRSLPWSAIGGVALRLRPSTGPWRAPNPSLWALEITLADARSAERSVLIPLPPLANLPNRVEAAVLGARPDKWLGWQEPADADELWHAPPGTA